MRVYTAEECQRKADYYHRLWLRTKHESLARQYWQRMAMWEERAMFGYVAHE